MGIDDFTASNGWLWRFRKGFGLGRCERLSSAKQRAAVSSERTRREPEDFLASLVANHVAVVGQRVGVILGVNEDCSDKLAPWVVGRRSDPKNLRNVCSPPCAYLASTEDLSRMPVGALEQYLDVLDRRMRAEKRVVAVFLTPDVAEAVSSDFKNIRLFSLGCSSMSNRNSSDVSILKHFKQLYRTFLLRRFTVLNGQPVEARPTLLSAMSLITMSWDCLKQDIIRTAFKDWGFHGCILSHSAAAEQKQGDAAGHAVDTGNVLLDSFVWTDEEPVLKDVVVKLEPRDTVDETEQRQAEP
ncbi:major centromere autoantigen B [Rhipicephalus microplus]|uniref:major centromere autoantigen B n=1 Tax=Rhipicephalus microplus TaxID=6941 RepID=UPI003F6CAABE